MKLTISYCDINDKLTCCRTLDSTLSFVSSNSYYPPSVIEVSCDFMQYMPTSGCLGTANNGDGLASSTLILRNSDGINYKDEWPTKPFKNVYNFTSATHSALSNILSVNWFGA